MLNIEFRGSTPTKLSVNGGIIETIPSTGGTFNESSYQNFISGLERALALGYKNITVTTSNNLIIDQIKEKCEVRAPNLIPLYTRTVGLIAAFESVTFGRSQLTLTEEQERVRSIAMSGESIFISGKAGTGKTVLLQAIIDSMPTAAVTSSTGMSACHLGGITVHRFAGIGIGKEPAMVCRRKMSPAVLNKWRNTKTLIIDEISMLNAATFDLIEELARITRRDTRPFGGMQVIVCGDFHQLPPVEGAFAFEAESWSKTIRSSHELRTVFRQKDQAFIQILNEIRDGVLSSESRIKLMSRIGSRKDIPKLRSSRAAADRDNSCELEKLEGPTLVSTAIDKGVIIESIIAPAVLNLRIGAKVILIWNLDVQNGLCNGSVGIVKEFRDITPVVEFDGRPVIIQPMTWEIKEGNASRTQLPLILGWAITIHKAQGMSLDCVDIELARLFAEGQGYTALSRVRSLQGLSIDCVPETFQYSEKVKAFYDSLK